jgi:D-sedoheptulose 7-phosphate isomerase
MTTFTDTYLAETRRIVEAIDGEAVERLAEGLAQVRERSGRLFILGVGGSAGHASHAVNDFRKLCGFEAYTPVDNVSELTARINELEAARTAGCFIGGVVGRDGGHTARLGDAVVVIPPLVEARVTPHTEGLCAVVWHLLVSHPRLQLVATKWESTVTVPV